MYMARFTEIGGTVREIRGKNHVVLIRPRNQEEEDMETINSKLGGSNENANVILEAKRKRNELEQIKTGLGPAHMQVDGPKNNGKDNVQADPKNLKGRDLDSRPAEHDEFFCMELSWDGQPTGGSISKRNHKSN